MKRDMLGKIHEEREMWEEERIEFWKGQSQLELTELASDHNELTTRKQAMDSTLSAKRAEKKQAE